MPATRRGIRIVKNVKVQVVLPALVVKERVRKNACSVQVVAFLGILPVDTVLGKAILPVLDALVREDLRAHRVFALAITIAKNVMGQVKYLFYPDRNFSKSFDNQRLTTICVYFERFNKVCHFLAIDGKCRLQLHSFVLQTTTLTEILFLTNNRFVYAKGSLSYSNWLNLYRL